MTIADLLELLMRFKAREITTKYLLSQLDDEELVTLARRQAVLESPKQERSPVQEAPPEVENKIQSLFEQVPPAGSKEQFHAENKQGKRCFDEFVAKEQEQGIFHTDQGSSPFTANLPGRCTGCGQVILKGDVIIIRAKERGVA